MDHFAAQLRWTLEVALQWPMIRCCPRPVSVPNAALESGAPVEPGRAVGDTAAQIGRPVLARRTDPVGRGPAGRKKEKQAEKKGQEKDGEGFHLTSPSM